MSKTGYTCRHKGMRCGLGRCGTRCSLTRRPNCNAVSGMITTDSLRDERDDGRLREAIEGRGTYMNRRDVLGALMLTGTAPKWVCSALAARGASGLALARDTPESQGIDSGAIEAFLNAIDAQKIELHSLMILRHGRVVAEGWWAPHRAAAPHSIYSASKTFTSTGIGLAVADGRLATSTKLVDLFPRGTRTARPRNWGYARRAAAIDLLACAQIPEFRLA